MLPTCWLLAKIQTHGALPPIAPTKIGLSTKSSVLFQYRSIHLEKKFNAPVSLAHGREIQAFRDVHPAIPKGLTKLKELNQIPGVSAWEIPQRSQEF